MSVVAVRKTKRKITVAADSILVTGYDQKRCDAVKLQEINDVICGFCGLAREGALMFQFLQTHKPAGDEERDLLQFLSEFMRWMKDLTGSCDMENAYIFVLGQNVYLVEDLYIAEVNDYFAIGAGEAFANTAMHLGHTPEEAVKVACDLSCFVAGPVVVVEREI